MRWLGPLVILSIVALAGQALAVPQPDAESAYAQGDYVTAYRLLLPLAEQGSVRAQEQIAEMYEKGMGVPQDADKARQWYRRAAEQSAKDAELKMEASQGMAAAYPTVAAPMVAPVILGGSRGSGVVPLTPMPRTTPIIAPAAWPPPPPAARPFFVPAPSHYHHHGHRH
jgi:hypothetical protein